MLWLDLLANSQSVAFILYLLARLEEDCIALHYDLRTEGVSIHTHYRGCVLLKSRSIQAIAAEIQLVSDEAALMTVTSDYGMSKRKTVKQGGSFLFAALHG